MYQKQKAIEKGLAQGKVVSADKWQTSTFKIIIRKILESQFQTQTTMHTDKNDNM